MRAALLPVVLIGSIAACGGKKDEPPKTAALAPAQDAAQPPPPPVDAAAPARVTSRSGPWSIDVPALTTPDKLASAGFQTTADWESSREPILRSTLVDSDDDHDFGLVAYTPRDGDGAGQIEWLETISGENAEVGQGAPFEAAGLCVEGVCPGAPASAAEKLGLQRCDTHRIEMEFRYRCPVAGTPLAVIFEGEVAGAKAGRDMAFAKIVKAKLDIHALAWEVKPGTWQPMVGCTTDCD